MFVPDRGYYPRRIKGVDRVTRYIALFSTLSAGGHRLTMSDLRYAFEREELEDVDTVVASGNVLFSYEDRPTEGLEDLITHVLRERFDMEIYVAVRSAIELQAAIEGNPFDDVSERNAVHTHFLARQPTQAQFASLMDGYAGRGPAKLAAGERSLFIDYGFDISTSRLTEAFIERRLGCQGTGRDMRALKRILEKMV